MGVLSYLTNSKKSSAPTLADLVKTHCRIQTDD